MITKLTPEENLIALIEYCNKRMRELGKFDDGYYSKLKKGFEKELKELPLKAQT